MHYTPALNKLYEDYATGLLTKKEFEGSIFKTIRENAQFFGLVGWNRQECDDYISSLYLRIKKAIDAYEDIGSSFESYIGSMVRLTAREYRSRQMRGYCEETAAWIAHLPDLYICENEAEYDEHKTAEPEDSALLTNPRQLLILVLKCCHYISGDFLEKIAPKLNLSPRTLSEMVNHLKWQYDKRITDIIALREKLNGQFYRCILCEKKLQASLPNSALAQQLKVQLVNGRKKLEKTRERYARSRLDPTNAQIAKLLGITKGTVDSVLYKLRQQGASFPVNDLEELQ